MSVDTSRAAYGTVTGEVLGERVCSRCGFNLRGQQIVREPHYEMLIVRCPECSTAAALEEYPSLGKWAPRLAWLTAAAFLLGVVAWLIGSSMVLGGWATNVHSEESLAAARRIAQAHMEHQKSVPQVVAGTQGVAANVPLFAMQNLRGYEYDAIEVAWWDAQDGASFSVAPSVLWRPIDRAMIIQSIFAMTTATIVGCTWAVVLCGVGRSRLWWVLVVLSITTSAILVVMTSGGYIVLWGSGLGWKYAAELGRDVTPLSAAWKFLAMELVFVAVGLAVGRTLARGMARWLLPPRHVGLMGFLWACDNLQMPRGAAGERRA